MLLAVLSRPISGYAPFPINDPTLNIGCGTGSWSPDGARLALETWDDSNPARNDVDTISSAGSGGLTRITSNPLGGHDVPGSYSPEGKPIIRYDANGNPAGMFVGKTTDGQLRQILPASADLNRAAIRRADDTPPLAPCAWPRLLLPRSAAGWS